MVKAVPGRKTDQSDSEWLAQLLRNGLVKPSYIPDKHTRQLRELTRLRVKMVQTRTAYKNRCHRILEKANVKLSTVLSNLFGEAVKAATVDTTRQVYLVRGALELLLSLDFLDAYEFELEALNDNKVGRPFKLTRFRWFHG